MKILKLARSLLFTLIFTVSLGTAVAYGQGGTVEGRVTDTEGRPVSNINISLVDTKFGAATGPRGYYLIRRVPSGEYTLQVSGVGYRGHSREVHVEAGQRVTVNVVLSTASEALEEIIVSAEPINKYSTEASEHVSKMHIRDIENARVYHPVTSGLLEDQVVTRFEDALTNVPGIFKLWESTGRGGDGAGYYSLRGFPVQPTMLNGLPSLTNGTLDPVNLERVEVIKGPAGTLYGSSLVSYGGLINVVTKSPYGQFGGEASFKTGSFGLNRLTADVNTPIDGDGDLALRVNSAYHSQNSFQDAGFNRSFFIAPSISYRVNERLSFIVKTEYLDGEQTNPTMLFMNRFVPLEANTPAQLGYEPKNSFTSNDLTISNPTFGLQARMEYRLSEEWTWESAISRSAAKSKGYYTYLWDLQPEDRTFARYLSHQNSTTLSTDIQQNLRGEFSLGGIRNRVVIGLDYLGSNLTNNSTGYVPFGSVTLQQADNSPLSRPAADEALADSPVGSGTSSQHTYSAYFSDVITPLPGVNVMAGLRLDHFVNEGLSDDSADNYEQTALSPKFGLVVQALPDRLSLFANYMNGFSNVAPRTQGDGSVKSFSPEHAVQIETGLKTELYGGRLAATLSYYDITVSNVVRPDPQNLNFYIQDGENYSRGLEASLSAYPAPGLNLTAGYSYNKSRVSRATSEEYIGRRPESAGPRHLANVWISYRLQAGVLRGLGMGVGGNYASENLVMNRKTTGQFKLPSYAVFQTSIFYETPNYRVNLKVNNLTDQVYYKGWTTVNPQQPRSITAGLTYKF